MDSSIIPVADCLIGGLQALHSKKKYGANSKKRRVKIKIKTHSYQKINIYANEYSVLVNNKGSKEITISC